MQTRMTSIICSTVHSYQLKPLPSIDMHEVKAYLYRTSQFDSSVTHTLAVCSLGVSKMSEYPGLNRGARSHHSPQGGGIAVIICPSESPLPHPYWPDQPSVWKKKTLSGMLPLEIAQIALNVDVSSMETSLQNPLFPYLIGHKHLFHY